LRNSYVKYSSSPRDDTTFNNGAKAAYIFEGFDFLSFVSIREKSASRMKARFRDFTILGWLLCEGRSFCRKS